MKRVFVIVMLAVLFGKLAKITERDKKEKKGADVLGGFAKAKPPASSHTATSAAVQGYFKG